MTNFNEIETLYFKDLAITKEGLVLKLEELKSKYNLDELLSFFLFKAGNSKFEKIQFILPIFFMTDILEEKASFIVESLSPKKVSWVIEHFPSLVSPKITIEYLVQSLTLLKQKSTYLHLDFDEEMSHFDDSFTQIKGLDEFTHDIRIQKCFMDLLEYLSNQEYLHENRHFVQYVKKHMSRGTSWDLKILGLLTNTTYQKEETIKILVSFQEIVTGEFFVNLFYEFFNKKLNEQDFLFITSLQTKNIIRGYNQTKFNNLVMNLISFLNDLPLNYSSAKKWNKMATFMNIVENLLSDDTKKSYCVAYWNFVKNKVTYNPNLLNENDSEEGFFIKLVKKIADDDLNTDILNFVQSYENILLLKDKKIINTMNLTPFEFSFISKFFIQFIDFLNDDKSVYLEFIQESKNIIALEYLSKTLVNKEYNQEIAELLIQKYKDEKFLIKKYIPFLHPIDNNSLLLDLSNSEDSDIRFYARKKLMTVFM